MLFRPLGRAASVVALGLLVTVAGIEGAAAQVLLNPMTQPKFVNPVPVPPAIDVTGGGSYVFDVKPCVQNLGLVDPVTGAPLMTNLWGYDGRYPGPTFVARKDVPVELEWRNRLVDENGVPVQHLLPVDTSIHWAEPDNWPACGVPLVTHIHAATPSRPATACPTPGTRPTTARSAPASSSRSTTTTTARKPRRSGTTTMRWA